MNIAVIGSGYVGLITGLCLSHKGHNVRCIDVNREIVDNLNKGFPNFYEEGLEKLLKSQLEQKRFLAFTKLSLLDIKVDIIIIAVGTPSDLEGNINLEYIKIASKEIGKFIKNIKYHVSIVIKSTVLPGTTDKLIKNILEKESGKTLNEFGLGMNPEFLREGSAIDDFINPDRIIIGSEDQKTRSKLTQIYKDWNCEILFVNCRTAEFIKYSNNCFLALQISTSNELANLAFELGGVDIEEIMYGVHLDKRWNPIINGKRINPGILNYLKAGCGFGGSCFPKDVKAIRNLGKERGVRMRMLESIIDVNNIQPLRVLDILSDIKNLHNRNVLFLGLSFKENTDDIRESPALKILPELSKKVKSIFAHDPMAIGNLKKEKIFFKNLEYIENWEDKISETEVIIILTNWKEYKKLESLNLESKILVDPRRIINRKKVNAKEYLSIGLNSKII